MTQHDIISSMLPAITDSNSSISFDTALVIRIFGMTLFLENSSFPLFFISNFVTPLKARRHVNNESHILPVFNEKYKPNDSSFATVDDSRI